MLPKHARLLTLIGAILLQSVIALIWLLSIPGDAAAAVLFGMSLQRLILAAVPAAFIVLAGIFLYLYVSHADALSGLMQRAARFKSQTWVPPILMWLGATGISFLLIGHAALGIASAIMQRLAPLLTLLFLVLVQCGLFLLMQRQQQPRRTAIIAPKTLIFFVITMGILIGVSLAVGLRHALGSSSYSGAGIPVLPLQMVLAIYITCTYACLDALTGSKPGIRKMLAAATAIFLFALAAWLWMRIPIPETHFTHASNLKEGEFILQSDSSTYDLNAHRMLMGLGLAGGQPLPRALFSFFLAITHLLFGSDVRSAIDVYTVVLALIPMLIYLLARRLDWSAAGVLAASLFIFREANQAQLSSAFILSSVRMLLSEPFTALFLVALVLAADRWLNSPSSRTWAAASGALLGLTALIRTQVLILLPLLLAAGFLAIRRSRRQGLQGVLWMLLGVLLVVLPWMSRNALRSGAFTFDDPAYAALWEMDAEQPSDLSLVAAFLNDPLGYATETWSYFNNNTLSSLYQLPWHARLDDDLLMYQSDHSTPPFYPAFRPPPTQVAALSIHLLLVLLGVAFAWQGAGWRGMLPVGIYMAYAASSSLARFSGWRFILPVDWIVLLYWSAGLLAVIRLFAGWLGIQSHAGGRPANEAPAKELPTSAIVTVLLLVGLSMPLGELLFPRRIEPLDRVGMQQRIAEASAPGEILNLAGQPDTHLAQGMLFFPVYLDNEQTFNRLKITDTELMAEKPLVRFYLVMQERTTIFLPVDEAPQDFPRAVPVITVSCVQNNNLLAYGVLVDADEPYWLLSREAAPPSCAP